MNFKHFSFLAVLLCSLMTTKAQVGGKYVYPFLSTPYSARLAALGGALVSVRDEDPTLIMYNPSSISPTFHTSLSVNCIDYFNSAVYASALYSHTFEKVGSFAFEFKTLNYGKFQYTNEFGEELGAFYAGDYAATVGWGRQLDSNWSIGANLKLILSDYEDYNSFGVAVDVAGSYYNPEKRLSLSLLVKNLGSQIKPFTPGNYERLPFDIQFALSQRLQHLPLRYHISFHSLYKWKMGYVGENDPMLEYDVITGEPQYPSRFSQEMNNFFRHIVFGIEIIPIKQLSLFISYNHHRNREMYILQKKTLAGFSYGFMLNFNNIQFAFSRAHYAAGATPNYFSFSLNINDLSKLSKEKKTRKLSRKTDN